MNFNEASKAARSYYFTQAFAGDMEGYTMDEMVEWTTATVGRFMSGELTLADVDPDYR